MTIAHTMEDYLPITTPFGNDDFKVLQKVVNIGIDAHLEGFTESQFFQTLGRFHFHFHINELSILLRRLDELWDSEHELADRAGSLADAIVEFQYGHETV